MYSNMMRFICVIVNLNFRYRQAIIILFGNKKKEKKKENIYLHFYELLKSAV